MLMLSNGVRVNAKAVMKNSGTDKYSVECAIGKSIEMEVKILELCDGGLWQVNSVSFTVENVAKIALFANSKTLLQQVSSMFLILYNFALEMP